MVALIYQFNHFAATAILCYTSLFIFGVLLRAKLTAVAPAALAENVIYEGHPYCLLFYFMLRIYQPH